MKGQLLYAYAYNREVLEGLEGDRPTYPFHEIVFTLDI